MLASVFFLVIGFAIASVCGWLWGEATDNRPLRIVSAIATVAVLTTTSTVISSVFTALSIGVPMTTAVHEYLDAASDQLAAGNNDFVAQQSTAFKRRAHVTYESGLFVDMVEKEVQFMKAGPQAD